MFPPTLYFASWIQQNILRIGLLSGFYNSPSWFHFNCWILPRSSRMMWLRTDPWNRQATPLVVRKTFLDLEEPGHRPARRPRTTKFWPQAETAILPQSGWNKGGREMDKKRDEMKGIERWYTSMRCSGICKVWKRVGERISKCPSDKGSDGHPTQESRKTSTFQQNNQPQCCWSLLQRLGMVGQVRTVFLLWSFMSVFDGNVNALGFRIAARSLQAFHASQIFPEGQARRIWQEVTGPWFWRVLRRWFLLVGTSKLQQKIVDNLSLSHVKSGIRALAPWLLPTPWHCSASHDIGLYNANSIRRGSLPSGEDPLHVGLYRIPFLGVPGWTGEIHIYYIIFSII